MSWDLIKRASLNRSGVAGVALVALISLAPSLAVSAEYPTDKPITIVVPYPPGGGVDTFARKLGPKLSELLKQTVIIDNRPGAAGAIASRAVARSAPDGYTLFLGGSQDLAISPALNKDVGYDPVKDFAPISMTHLVPYLFVVGANSKIQSIADVVKLAKESPGKIMFGSYGIGSLPHLAGEIFQTRTGTKLLHVPFKGAAQTITEVTAGRLDVGIESIGTAISLVESGTLRALAVADTRRWPTLPNVPTVIESGYPDFSVGGWSGILAPAGTPEAIVNKVSEAVQSTVKSPEFVEWFAQRGYVGVGSTPKEFASTISSELARWSGVVQSAGIKAVAE